MSSRRSRAHAMPNGHASFSRCRNRAQRQIVHTGICILRSVAARARLDSTRLDSARWNKQRGMSYGTTTGLGRIWKTGNRCRGARRAMAAADFSTGPVSQMGLAQKRRMNRWRSLFTEILRPRHTDGRGAARFLRTSTSFRIITPFLPASVIDFNNGKCSSRYRRPTVYLVVAIEKIYILPFDF